MTFFLPNINSSANQNNTNTTNSYSNNIKNSNSNINNKSCNINISEFNLNNNLNKITSNNNFQSKINYNNLIFDNFEYNPNLNEKDANKKKAGKKIHSFRRSVVKNRYFLNPLNNTKLISPETNSSLFFNNFNNDINFKNSTKNTTSAKTNNVFWNNSTNEINFHNQKKSYRKHVMTNRLSIQNMSSNNNIKNQDI